MNPETVYWTAERFERVWRENDGALIYRLALTTALREGWLVIDDDKAGQQAIDKRINPDLSGGGFKMELGTD